MSYLLTSGIITDNMMEYVKDMLFLNFKLNPTDLPYNTKIGIDKRVHEVSKAEFTDAVRLKLDTFLKDINDRHGLNMSIQKMAVRDSKIEIIINFVNNKILEYELALT